MFVCVCANIAHRMLDSFFFPVKVENSLAPEWWCSGFHLIGSLQIIVIFMVDW